MSPADNLRAAMKTSIVLTELQHNQVQLRMLQILLSLSMMFDMFDPATFILTEPSSIIHRVSALAYSPELLAYIFVMLGVLLAPYALMQIFCPCHARRRGITQLACLALAVASLQWMYMAYLSRDLDIESITGVWIRTGLGALGYSLVLALTLNAERARQIFDCKK